MNFKEQKLPQMKNPSLKKPKMTLNIKHANYQADKCNQQNFLKIQDDNGVTKRPERKRRASENIQTFDYLNILKDQTVNQGFDNFFHLQQKIGEGAQSLVFKCVEKSTSQTYAAKVCKKRDLELFENMRVNYQILMELDHKSIIKGKYLFMDEKHLTCQIVVEYFDYPELGDYLKKYSPGEKEVSQILSKLLQCLAYLEEKGVCHRDIKPQNILYDPATKSLKLIDFELARMIRYSHEKLQLLSKCGTLAYRAPETFKGRYGIPVDMWSLGVVAFELLTGQHPFRTGYSKTTIKRICEEEICYDDYDLTPCAIKFLQKTLQKNPKKRLRPREALSSTFIVKYSVKKEGIPNLFCSTKIQKAIFGNMGGKQLGMIYTIDDQMQFSWEKSYDEDDKFVFMDTMNKDIGVRRYIGN